MGKDSKKPVPAYVAFGSFLSFIKGLGKTGVPDRIDKTVMQNYSGSVQYALLPALTWLKLIDGEGAPKDSLYKLVKASPKDETLKAALAELMGECYGFLYTDQVNADTATGGQVQEAFKAQGMSGATIAKAMTFFMQLAKEADTDISPHIKAPKVPRSTKKKAAVGSKNGNDDAPTNSDAKTENTPSGYTAFDIPIPGTQPVKLSFPNDMTEGQWAMFSAVLATYTEEFKKVQQANSKQADNRPASDNEATEDVVWEG